MTLAKEIAAVLRPVQERFPCLEPGSSEDHSSEAYNAVKAALAERYGSCGLAAALDASRALLVAWEAMPGEAEISPAYHAVSAASHVLDCFIFTAPAATLADAIARIDHWATFCADSSPLDSTAALVYAAIKADLARLTTGSPAPASATFADWPFQTAFEGA